MGTAFDAASSTRFRLYSLLSTLYSLLRPSRSCLPSRNLLGEAYEPGIIGNRDDPRKRQSLLLGCTCGITDCWFLLATITVEEHQVVWSEFRQFYRDWHYDLGPFVFERRAYERELQPKPIPTPPPLPTPRENA